MASPNKRRILDELLKCATAKPMEILFYKDFAPRVGMNYRGPWRDVLNEISRDETIQGRPDLTYLLRNRKTGYPGQIGFRRAERPSPQQKDTAKIELQKVIDFYSPGARNPY